LMGCRCALKWRQRFESSHAVTPAQLAQFDQGWCAKCLGICACKRCLTKPSPAVGGAAPVFAKCQEEQFALHTLAVLKPHIDEFLAARDAEVQPLILHGKYLLLCTYKFVLTCASPQVLSQSHQCNHGCMQACLPLPSFLLINSMHFLTPSPSLALSCYFVVVNSCTLTCPVAQLQAHITVYLCHNFKIVFCC